MSPITVCVPALLWEDTVQRLFRDAGVPASTRTVLAPVERAPAVPLSINDPAYRVRTPLVGAAAQAFRVAGVEVPPSLASLPSCHGIP